MSKSKYDPYRKEIMEGRIPAKEIADKIGNGCTPAAVRSARSRFLKTEQQHARYRAQENERGKKYAQKSLVHATNTGADWLDHEDELLLSSKETGLVLAKRLRRSLYAIYRRRSFLINQPV